MLNKVNFLEYKKDLRNANDTNTELHECIHSFNAENEVITNTNFRLQKGIDYLKGDVKKQKKIIKKQSGKLVLSFKYFLISHNNIL